MKGWYGDKQKHSLASKGVKTAMEETKEWERDRMAGLRTYYISYLDVIRGYDMEEFWEDEDERGLVNGLDEDDWAKKQIERRMGDYTEDAVWHDDGDGYIEVTGRIYFKARDKKSALKKVLNNYDFNAYDVHDELSGEVIASV